jgi:hypothetical protein
VSEQAEQLQEAMERARQLCEARGLNVTIESARVGYVVRQRDGTVMARGRQLEDVLGRLIHVLEDEG